MAIILDPRFYYATIVAMAITAVIVFIALQFIEAPYGMTFSKKWGPSVSNRTGWIIMEAPAFCVMLGFLLLSPARYWVNIALSLIFLLHYFNRSFIFPMKMRGRSRMSWLIPAMGATFNIINAYLIGAWLFHFAPQGYYDLSSHPEMLLPLLAGLAIFAIGMRINMHSDHIIRHLRRPGEKGHKIPRGGMFGYVTSANYFGEILEWCGYGIMTLSWAGALFALWTAANLVPRAAKLHKRYENEFGLEYTSLNRKKIIPFIY